MLIWLWLSAFVIVVDQITKRVVDTSMQLHQSIELAPFFQLTYLRNQGAAFSFLSGAGGWQRWFFIIGTGPPSTSPIPPSPWASSYCCWTPSSPIARRNPPDGKMGLAGRLREPIRSQGRSHCGAQKRV